MASSPHQVSHKPSFPPSPTLPYTLSYHATPMRIVELAMLAAGVANKFFTGSPFTLTRFPTVQKVINWTLIAYPLIRWGHILYKCFTWTPNPKLKGLRFSEQPQLPKDILLPKIPRRASTSDLSKMDDSPEALHKIRDRLEDPFLGRMDVDGLVTEEFPDFDLAPTPPPHPSSQSADAPIHRAHRRHIRLDDGEDVDSPPTSPTRGGSGSSVLHRTGHPGKRTFHLYSSSREPGARERLSTANSPLIKADSKSNRRVSGSDHDD